MTSTDSDKHTVGDPDGNVVRDTCTSAAAVSCQPELDNNTSKQIKAKSKTQPKDKSKQPKSKSSKDHNKSPASKFICEGSCSLSENQRNDSIRCCLCMKWIHCLCLSNADEAEYSGIWMCSECRLMPAHLVDIRHQLTILIKLNNGLLTKNADLNSQLFSKHKECSELRQELIMVQTKLETERMTFKGNKCVDTSSSIKKPVIPSQNPISETASNDSSQNLNGAVAPDCDEMPEENPPCDDISTRKGKVPPIPAPRTRKNTTNFSNFPNKQSISVLGDSMTRNVQLNLDSQNLFLRKNSQVYTIDDACDIVDEVDSDHILIHVGTNHLRNESAAETITKLRVLENKLCSNVNIASVSLSGIVGRKSNNKVKNKIRMINAAMKLICEHNCWSYIDNRNISLNHLTNDGVHLSSSGVALLEDNMLTVLSKHLVNFIVHATNVAG